MQALLAIQQQRLAEEREERSKAEEFREALMTGLGSMTAAAVDLRQKEFTIGDDQVNEICERNAETFQEQISNNVFEDARTE